MNTDPPPPACCASAQACIFAKALLARAAHCDASRRVSLPDGDVLECSMPPARLDCEELAALLHEHARRALRLPPAGRPMMHVQALRLQREGLAALREALGGPGGVRDLVLAARQRHGNLSAVPWHALITVLPKDRDQRIADRTK